MFAGSLHVNILSGFPQDDLQSLLVEYCAAGIQQ